MASIIRRTYKTKLPNGKIVTKKCRVYSIEYTDPDGRRRRAKGFTDKGATEQLAARLERDVARGAVGLVDPFRAHRSRPVLEHLTHYIADLITSGCDGKYVSNMKSRLKIMIEECGWAVLGDVDTNGFIRWRERRRGQKRTGTRADLTGTSAETLNQYLDTARAFLNWCAKTERIDGVPFKGGKLSTLLAGVGKVAGEKVRKRRALTDEQVAKLLSVTSPERALVYRVGFSVGLRRQELADLKWGDVQLSGIPPYFQLRAEATKARRADRVYFPTSLADALREHLPADASDSDPVFPRPPSLRRWKKDLASAGIPWADEMGRRADFHGGTRKTLCSRMHRSGVPLAKAMRVMRHTDARLTMTDYVDDQQIGLQDVLPEISAEKPPVPRAATGAS